MSVALATTGLDPAAAAVLAVLQRQADSLAAVSARLDHAIGQVPRSADGTWRGPANSAYDAGLSQLRRLASAADTAVGDALDATRATVATLTAGAR